MHIEIGAGRDWYDVGMFVFTAAATISAIVGGVIALRAYVATNSASAHNHMHQMFEHFLAARNDHATKAGRPSRRRRTRATTSLRESSDFGGSVLYYLEEVHAWVCHEERFANGRIYRLLFFGLKAKRRKLDVINSWRATLVTQLISHRQDVLDSLLDYSSCYGAEFLAFAAATLNDDRLTKRARISVRRAGSGRRRPLGREERRQRRAMQGAPSSNRWWPVVGFAVLGSAILRRHLTPAGRNADGRTTRPE